MVKMKKAIWLLIFASLLMALAGCATTQKSSDQAKKEVKTDWKFHTIVDVKFVQQYAKLPRPENSIIIDSRPARPKYDKGYIPTAISIPNSKFDKMINKLPKDKNTLLIFYCGGLKCKLSHKSARKAEKLGYNNVKVFATGFPAWKKAPGTYAGVEASYVKKQLDKSAPMVLVDSRPKRPKYDKGHIPTAISLPDSKFDKMKGDLPQDKNTPLVFYCGGYT